LKGNIQPEELELELELKLELELELKLEQSNSLIKKRRWRARNLRRL
jgi:hypothetical protein